MPVKESVSHQQIDQILGVVNCLRPYLLAAPELDGVTPPELDGGAVCAAATTFIKACNRLDIILDDAKRWDLSAHDALYESILKSQAVARELHQNQTITLQNMRKPSVKLRPEFTRVREFFVAYYGDLMDEGSLIMGRGLTPQEALDDFDAKFTTGVDGHFKIISPKPETTP